MLKNYSTQDFEAALSKLKDLDDILDYDALTSFVSQIVGEELVKELEQIPFEDSILAAFANGLVIGMLTAENKYKPKNDLPPLIEH